MASLNVVFLGSPEFAVPSLQTLMEHPKIEVSLVVTQPDRPVGRGRKVQAPPVKRAADEAGIRTLQPSSLRDEESIAPIESVIPDALIVVAYGEILRRRLLELPRFGCLNVHPSLLPRYRGSSPVPAAILNGDDQTGISYMRLTRRMDAGPIVSQATHPLSGAETTGTLMYELATEAAESLPDVLLDWASGDRAETPQDESQATYTRELRKSDAQIDWREPAVYLERFVRAMNPWPAAWTLLDDQRVTIHRARIDQSSERAEPGRIALRGGSVVVQTGDGALELVEVQPSGKKTMQATDWYRGARMTGSAGFTSPEEPKPPLIEKR